MVFDSRLLSELRRSGSILLGIILLGFLMGIFIQLLGGFRLQWIIAILAVMCVLLALSFLRRPRDLLLVLLIMCLPIGYNYHLSYRAGHIGISDGFTIEIMDSILFILLLVWFYEVQFKDHGKVSCIPFATTPIALFLLACLLTFFKSNDVELSIYGFVDSIKGFVFYFYIANSIQDENDVKLILNGLQLSLALIGAVCILEATLETNFTTTFESIAQANYATVFRSAGLSTPTLTAGYLAAVIPLASIYYFLIEKNPWKITLLISVTLGLIGLLLTLTRAAWVSLAFGFIPLAFLLFRRRILKLHQIGLLVLVIGVIAFFNQGKIALRFSEGLDNLKARNSIMLVAINMVKSNPILGVGLNTYQEEMDKYIPTSLPHHFIDVVHNKYMFVWSETGSVGILCFLLIWLVVIYNIYKLTKSEVYFIYVTTAGIFSAFIVMGCHMMFESYARANRMYIFWLCLGLLAGIKRLQLDRIGKTDQK